MSWKIYVEKWYENDDMEDEIKNSNKMKISLSMYLHNKITKKLYNNLIKSLWWVFDGKLLVVISPKGICFDLPIQINESVKHHIEFTVNCNKYLAEY